MCKKKPGKVAENKSQVVRDVPLACANEQAAAEFLERQRWGDSPCCPDCGDINVYKMTARNGERNKDFRWRCRGCGLLYSVRFGTVMADSRIPLRFWVLAFWMACASKKGMSAKQIQRLSGLSYKSALFLMHRVRFAMVDISGVKLSGTVECDETFVGGRPRHRVPLARALRTGEKTNYQTRKDRKVMVFAAIQRDGKAIARVVPDVNVHNLPQAVREYVDQSARLMTDENKNYRKVGREFSGGHFTVNHGEHEYARGEVSINSAESFFANLKRGIHGTYHSVSKRHLPRYLAEFEFRYNNRHIDDGERTTTAIKASEGKRLMYRKPEEDVA